MRSAFGLPAAALVVALGSAACGSGHPRPEVAPKPAAPPGQATSSSQTPPPAHAPQDPVRSLIATSEDHFVRGERELKNGHLGDARIEFDRALDVLLQSPYGGRSDPRIREQFDRLVDRISAFEMTALAAGDGFAEKPSEPASIDAYLEVSTFAKPEPAEETTRAVAADLQNTAHDVPIPLNERVLAYVELFQGKLRDWVQAGLERGTRYLPMIQNVFRAEGLPLDLAYVPLIESAFKPTALSRAKAKGVWQFMRGTALENGLKHDWYIDERADPEKATIAAAKYLRTLHRMFDGDWHLALASYNGGPGRVQRALKRAGVDNFWDLSRKPGFLPRETREYVPMILAAMVIARNPAQYGFHIQPAEPIAYEKVAVPRAIDLRRVAEWTGATIDEIQALNPELRRWTTPVRYPDYEVKVPVGTAERFRERLASLSDTRLAALNWHTVRRGETLASIARRFKVSRSDLAAANNLSTRSRLRVGQELVIPRAPAALLSARVERPAPTDAPEAVVASRSLSGSAVAPKGSRSSESRLVYRVKRGDTLFSIAQLFETTVAAIKSWNKHLRGTRINPGDRLTIFANRTRRTE